MSKVMSMILSRRRSLKTLAGLALVPFWTVGALGAGTAGVTGPLNFFKLSDIIVFFERSEDDPAVHYLSVKLVLDLADKGDLEYFRVHGSEIPDLLKIAYRTAGFETLSGRDGATVLKKISVETLGKMAGAPPVLDVLIVEMTIL